MRTFQINQTHAVLFGLSWRAYDAYESRHSQTVAWQNDGYSWMATYKLGGDLYVGLINDKFSRPIKGGLYSAAVLVALHPRIKGKTALVLFKSNAEVALIGLLDGCVVLDVCAESDDDVAQYRNNFAQRCSGKPFLTFGPPEKEQFDEHFDEHFEWNDLLGSGRFDSRLGKAKLAKFKSDRSAWITAGMLGFAAVALIGLVVKNHFDTLAEQQARERQLLASDPVRIYEEGVQRFLNDSRGIALLSENIQMLRRVLGAIPLAHGGWSLSKITCDLDAARCTVDWLLDSSKVGTFKSFAGGMPRLPEGWSHVYGPSTSKITSSFPLQVARVKLPPKASWPSYQAFLTTEVSRWQATQALGMNLEIKEPSVQALQSGAQPHVVEGSPRVIHASTWSTAGTSWWLADVFFRAPQNVSLERLILTNNGPEFTFSAEGRMYVQKT